MRLIFAPCSIQSRSFSFCAAVTVLCAFGGGGITSLGIRAVQPLPQRRLADGPGRDGNFSDSAAFSASARTSRRRPALR